MKEKIEIKKCDEDILAIIVKKIAREKLENGMTIYSNPSDPIQAGYLKRSKGYKAKPHYHPNFPDTKVKPVRQEVIYVLKGSVRLTLYTLDGEKISSVILEEGDLAIIYQGHEVEFLEESLLLEIKQGPYSGREKDKVMLEVA